MMRGTSLFGGSVKRLLVIASTSAMAATAAFGASAVAAPSASGISHRNVHVCATPAQAGYAACMSVRHDTLRNGKPVTNAAVPAGYGPADIQAAYKLPTTASNPP